MASAANRNRKRLWVVVAAGVLLAVSFLAGASRGFPNRNLPPELLSLLKAGRFDHLERTATGRYTSFRWLPLSLKEYYKTDVYKFNEPAKDLAMRFKSDLKGQPRWRLDDVPSYWAGPCCAVTQMGISGHPAVEVLICEEGEASKATVFDFAHRGLTWK